MSINESNRNSFFPEICFQTDVGRKCYPIFSTPTFPPGPVIPSEQVDIGRITGFDAKRQVQFESSIGIDPIELVPKMAIRAVDIKNRKRFSVLKLTFTTEDMLRKLSGMPELLRIGKEVVCIPFRRTLDDCDCKEGDVSGNNLGIIELLGHEARPDILHIRANDELSMTWSTVGFFPDGQSLTTPDGQPLPWVPWAVAGGLAALCIGAAIYTCGKCAISVGPVDIGYHCKSSG